jgi:hypothetical protein
MDDKIVTFKSYYDPMLAYIIRTKLEANNIQCYIADDNIIWAKPYFNQLLGGVKIRVFEKDFERCLEILATDDDQHEQNHFEIDKESNGNACPYCASTNISYGVATEFKFHLPSLLVSLFFWVPFYFRTTWRCFNCYREF